MKKKLEAELISIAHRILKLKNRSEIEQLQQETLKLYEKLSVLRFVEENFSDIKPTIGHASAEEKLEEIYGLEETLPNPQGGNDEAPVADKQKEEEPVKTDDLKEEKPAEEHVSAGEGEPNTDEPKQDAANDKGEDVGEGEAVSQEEIEYTHEETDEDVQPEGKATAEEAQPEPEQEEVKEEPKQEEVQEEKQEEQPAQEVKQEESKKEEPKKQKEISFEDFENYIEPEFVKKSDIAEPNNINIEFLPKDPEIIAKQEEQAEHMWEEPQQQDQQQEEPKQEEAESEPVLDWRDWEPSKSKYAAKPEEPKEEAKKTLNDAFAKTITLGLNDRIAFEKNLFGGSGEDLNRVVSQLNTLNSFAEAKDFIEDLVKPDYNNWRGKEEYEERFMALVEKRFE